MFRTRTVVQSIVFIALVTALVRADVIVTLVPQDDNNTVPAGATIPVDILLSVDGDDNPLPNLRLIQFDFADTGDSIMLSAFEWQIDLPNGSDFYFQSVAFPSPSAAYFGTSAVEGFILNLDDSPIRVATVSVVVNGSGSLDAIATVGDADASGALISANFESPDDFNRVMDNLRGGVLNFQVAATGGGGATDSDNDDVPDSIDAFPNDNDETTDTDNDNIGNVADTDDDADGVADDVDSTPLGPQEAIGNDNESDGNNNVNENENDNSSGGNGGNNENDNGETNMGPRATGGFCAQGMILTMLGSFVGLSAMHWVRRRSERHSQT